VPPSRTYPLKLIPPEKVAFSETNPRGESAEEIFKDETFERLKDSVFRFGVLVPIVVHEQKDNVQKPYRLVDGERRLRAALEAKIKRIPAHIAASEDPLDDLVQAVHIHMLRKQWSPVAQARALKRIKSQRQKSGPRMSEQDAAEDLQALTGCSDTKLKSLRRAARYSEAVLEAVEERQLAFSHLVQFEESFVEQIEKHYPDLLTRLGKKEVRESLVEKARQRVLTSSRALMDNVVPVISRAKSAEEKKCASQILEDFVTNLNMPAEEVLKQYDKKYPPAQEDLLHLCDDIVDSSEVLVAMLIGLRGNALAGFPKVRSRLVKSLDELHKEVAARLKSLRSTSK